MALPRGESRALAGVLGLSFAFGLRMDYGRRERQAAHGIAGTKNDPAERGGAGECARTRNPVLRSRPGGGAAEHSLLLRPSGRLSGVALQGGAECRGRDQAVCSRKPPGTTRATPSAIPARPPTTARLKRPRSLASASIRKQGSAVGPAPKRRFFMGDGSEWIWNIANQHFPGAIPIVDRFHARQHLWDPARKLYPTKRPNRERHPGFTLLHLQRSV